MSDPARVRPTRRPPRPQTRAVGNRRIIAEGLEHSFWGDFYHNAMTASWPAFIGLLAAAFVLLNVVFALIFLLGPAPIANAAPGSFLDAFFFSVETTSTVGYGDMHPQTLFGHIVATCENFVGMVLLAAMTGLVFARFSRPRSRLMFARHPVIMDHNGVPTLILRLANARNSYITEANAKLWMLGPTASAEGRRFVSFQAMKLLRGENPMLALSWSLFHPIDEDSPLYGMAFDELLASEINVVLSVTGIDETSSQTVHARQVWAAADVRPGHEYVDIFSLDDDGVRHVHFHRLHDTRPVGAAQAP